MANDTLSGGAENNTYIATGDRTYINDLGGTDTIQTSLDIFSLTPPMSDPFEPYYFNNENLVFIGAGKTLKEHRSF